MSTELLHDCPTASVETGSYVLRPSPGSRRPSKDPPKTDFHVKNANVDLNNCKEFLLLPRIQIVVQVPFEQVFEDGIDSNFLYNLAGRLLSSLDGHERHPSEVVYRLEMKSDFSIAHISDSEPPRKPFLPTSDDTRWRLVMCTKLSPLCCLCVAERDRTFYGCNIVLRISGQDSAYLPTSPTTGVPLSGASLYAQMSRPRAGFSAVQTDKGFLAVGGYNREGSMPLVESFNVSRNAWDEFGALKTNRARFATVIVKDAVYAIGGSNGRQELASLERCDMKTDHWEKMKTAMHTARSCFSAAELGGIIYAVGGSHYSYLLKAAEAFDPSSERWQVIAPMPTARSDLAVVSCGGKIYAIGGATYGWRCVSTVECYTPNTNSWQTVAPLMSPRRNAAAVAFEDKIYVIGGYDGRQVLTSVEVYDSKQNKWTQGPPISLGRSSSAAAISNGLLFVIGGYTGDSFLNSVECYDTQKDEWTSYV